MARPSPYDEFDDDSQPKPKVSILTLLLCVLNVVAAGAFVYCLLLDMEKRQAWSYAVFLHDMADIGLPLQEEEDNPFTASRESLPKKILRPDQLASAHKGGGTGPFQTVEEHFPIRIRPSHFTDDNLKDIFGEHKPYTKTLEEEVELVKKEIFDRIDRAAREIADADKTDADKRTRLARVLLPMALSNYQVRAFDKQVRETKDVHGDLVEALKRRMLLDILQPLATNRPGDSEVPQHLEADPKDPKAPSREELAKQTKSSEELEREVKDHLEHVVAGKYKGQLYHGKEWDQKERDTIEKRKAIAFLLFTVAHVNRPDGAPLDAKAPDRAQIVVGLYEFALTAQAYTNALLSLERRMLALLQTEREGGLTEVNGTLHRTPGFVDRYPFMVQKLKEIVGEIGQAQKRLTDLKSQRDQAQKNLEDRKEHEAEITLKLKGEREKTAKLYYNLRLVQASLFRAQVELADAAEINFEKEKLLRQFELKQGGKAP